MGGQDGVRADADAWQHRYRCCNATVDRPFADERTPHLSVARDPEKAASPDHEWFAPKNNVAGNMMLQGKVVATRRENDMQTLAVPLLAYYLVSFLAAAMRRASRASSMSFF